MGGWQLRLLTIIEDRESRLEQQIDSVVNKTGVDRNIILDTLNFVDKSKKYWSWILRQIKFKNVQIPDDDHWLLDVINKYKKVKNKLSERDINKYRTIWGLESELDKFVGSKRKGELLHNPLSLPGVELINEYNDLKLYKVSNSNSLAKLGLGTKWCTRKDYPNCQAHGYLRDHGFIYIITKGDKPFIQFTPSFSEFVDVRNKPVRADESVRRLLKPVEDYIVDEPVWSYLYAKNVIGGRWKEVEDYIVDDPMWAYKYARDVIKDRWPEAEPYIKQDPKLAYKYAKDVIKGRWPEAESAIREDAQAAFGYASSVIRGRWREAEPYIMKDPKVAYWYAKDVIKGRWPEAEQYIMKNPQMANWYAMIGKGDGLVMR